MTAASSEVLGTVSQAAEFLQVDRATVWELVADGELVAERPDDPTDRRWIIRRRPSEYRK